MNVKRKGTELTFYYADDSMLVDKNDRMKIRKHDKKPRAATRGFFYAFWKGSINLRLVTDFYYFCLAI